MPIPRSWNRNSLAGIHGPFGGHGGTQGRSGLRKSLPRGKEFLIRTLMKRMSTPPCVKSREILGRNFVRVETHNPFTGFSPHVLEIRQSMYAHNQVDSQRWMFEHKYYMAR